MLLISAQSNDYLDGEPAPYCPAQHGHVGARSVGTAAYDAYLVQKVPFLAVVCLDSRIMTMHATLILWRAVYPITLAATPIVVNTEVFIHFSNISLPNITTGSTPIKGYAIYDVTDDGVNPVF